MYDKSKKKPIIIFVGPSGVGKGTIEQILFTKEELKLKLSVSATTRSPRVGEIDGLHYFFISKDDFKSKIEKNELLEYSFHFDNYYGTLCSEIDRIHNENKIPFLEIETYGAKQILQNQESTEKYNIITVFILPPSFDDLKYRIIGRNTETQADINKRLKKAQEELADKDIFKYNVVNDDPIRAAEEIEKLLMRELYE
ncbi:guanylate kinase [Mycoplasma zalophidermidis]|uniref:Guanylate kinase n=1 Tax=Mycoplasma zalophidermidis TaxID=398174 RepID=A0ABS6DRI1_9MOLU|nr:guanylate kinase [Mycoplasma zalophidermidis]MBU4689681.1 guanylate kinase [Mycoplasma zalophidermidis]MBU4693581.1 guanylate kinase [Mycoplasma zalophidermidis]MCR8966460.1 guanylate kinase [Mycoplasma zalophidermidis]